MILSAPTRLSEEHICELFSSGEAILDDWLKRRAQGSDKRHSARTFVVCDETSRVVAYYTLSAGSVDRYEAPKKLQRNMPDPLPVLLLGRLAVDQEYQNLGLGGSLLKDAMIRALRVSQEMAFAALLVHAISDEARNFYLKRGFLESPIEPMTLCLPLETIRQAFSE